MSVLDSTRIFTSALPVASTTENFCVYSNDAQLSTRLYEVNSVVAVGAFDGVHLGHRALIADVIEEAQNKDALSVVVTFNPDPATVIAPAKASQNLLSIEDRIRAMLSLGVDAVFCINFTHKFSQLSYEEFFNTYIVGTLKCISLHVGENFRMGAGGQGDCAHIKALASEVGIEFNAHKLTEVLSAPVSATRVRSLLNAGKTDIAAKLLDRPHMVRGRVEHGRGQGTSFGFPTANMVIDGSYCLPAEGVYAGWVGTGERMWPAAINVGASRTFGGKVGMPLLEATLLGFEGNLYNQDLMACFDVWIRAPRMFPTLHALETTVLDNIDWVRNNIGEGEVSD